MTVNCYPWPEPISVYDSDGPRNDTPVEFVIANITFRIEATRHVGMSTGRTRYSVRCVDCDKVLHHATTGPSCRIEDHLRDAHDFTGEISYEDMQ